MASRFQVGGCQSLGFGPKLKLSLTGKGKTKSGNHPTLLANLTTKSGQANIDSAKVTLPLSLALDPNNSKVVCPFATAQAVHGGAVGCKANTIVGKVTATTPLLSKPLTGNVYLVQGIRFSHGQQIKTLPTLLIPLRGQIALDLRASDLGQRSGCAGQHVLKRARRARVSVQAADQWRLQGLARDHRSRQEHLQVGADIGGDAQCPLR